MIITISGKPGSGKNTVAKLLSEKLGYKVYHIGGLRRKMASDRGISLAELNKIGESDPITDTSVDNYQKELARKEGDIIVVGRISFHFMPQSVKIFLDVSLNTGAERILNNDRKTEKFSNIGEAIKSVKERIQSDTRRYKKYYNLDCYDLTHYDLIIDTTSTTAEEVAVKIVTYLKIKKYINKE